MNANAWRHGRAFREAASALLTEGHGLRFTAHGQSMLPFLRDGDVVSVVPVAAADVRCGDVLLYARTPDRPLLHRVIHIIYDDGPSRFTMRGDFSRHGAEIIGPEHLLGRAVSFTRRGREHPLDTVTQRRLALLWRRCHPFSGLLLRWARHGRRLTAGTGGNKW